MSEEWIGFNADSDTTVETDSAQTDADGEGQGPSVWMRIYAVAIPAPTIGAVAVTGKPPFDTPRYLNVLHDVDANGKWGGGVHNEWIGRNIPVDLSQGVALPNGNRRIWVQLPAFYYSDDNVLDPRYLRATLSREKVDASRPWTGNGPTPGFTHGETEDHLIDLSNLKGAGKKCTLRWEAVQGGAAVGVVKMSRTEGKWSFRVKQVTGPCPGKLATTGTLFSLGITGCVPVAGPPIGFAHGMTANPWNAGPGGGPPWNSAPPPYTATWDCPAGVPRCVEQCAIAFAYDPPDDVVLEPAAVYFGYEDKVIEKEEPWCDPKERGELCTEDGRIATCGDGRVDIYEKCDDGNRADGDGCSSLCFPEEKGEPVFPDK